MTTTLLSTEKHEVISYCGPSSQQFRLNFVITECAEDPESVAFNVMDWPAIRDAIDNQIKSLKKNQPTKFANTRVVEQNHNYSDEYDHFYSHNWYLAKLDEHKTNERKDQFEFGTDHIITLEGIFEDYNVYFNGKFVGCRTFGESCHVDNITLVDMVNALKSHEIEF